MKVELWLLRGPLFPAAEVLRLGAGLSSVFRNAPTHLLRIALSQLGHEVEIVEARLKEEADEVQKRLHTIDEQVGKWRRASSD